MFDVGYAFRVLSLMLRHRSKTPAKNIFDDFVLQGRCWPRDLDVLWHMNNSRYLRHCDFGRYAFLLQSGLWNGLERRRLDGMKNAGILVSAVQAQYRQSFDLGDRFSIITRTCGWDEHAFYLEQFIIAEKNKQTAFSLLVRLAVTPRDLPPQALVDDIYKGAVQSPVLPSQAQLFNDNYKLSFKGSQ